MHQRTIGESGNVPVRATSPGLNMMAMVKSGRHVKGAVTFYGPATSVAEMPAPPICIFRARPLERGEQPAFVMDKSGLDKGVRLALARGRAPARNNAAGSDRCTLATGV